MFQANCLPILIGSLPLTDHHQAMEEILKATPDIPLWPQLPKLPREGMVRQFLNGFPGLQQKDKRFWIASDTEDFGEQMAAFYADYMTVEEDPELLLNSRFALTEDTAKGFEVFSDIIKHSEHSFIALKGQVTGPVTVGVGTKDQHDRSIFYDDNLRDMLVKLITQKGCWQIAALKEVQPDIQPIIFIDEPAIVSFGSTGFIGVTKEMVTEAVSDVVTGIQTAGGLAGVHICANGDWEPALSSAADIISFDAFFYFDNFILFKDELTRFIDRGGILAWGIVPTGDPQILAEIDAVSLYSKWQEQLDIIASFGFTQEKLMQQTFIAPSCGTGSLSIEHAMKVLNLTAEISMRARNALYQM